MGSSIGMFATLSKSEKGLCVCTTATRPIVPLLVISTLPFSIRQRFDISTCWASSTNLVSEKSIWKFLISFAEMNGTPLSQYFGVLCVPSEIWPDTWLQATQIAFPGNARRPSPQSSSILASVCRRGFAGFLPFSPLTRHSATASCQASRAAL